MYFICTLCVCGTIVSVLDTLWIVVHCITCNSWLTTAKSSPGIYSTLEVITFTSGAKIPKIWILCNNTRNKNVNKCAKYIHNRLSSTNDDRQTHIVHALSAPALPTQTLPSIGPRTRQSIGTIPRQQVQVIIKYNISGFIIISLVLYT